MLEGTITITQKEAARHKVLSMVSDGTLGLKEAAGYLGVSYRHAKRLRGKVQQEGLAGMAHGNRGRSPSNKIPEELRKQILELSQEEFSKFNDTHFTEELAGKNIVISRESVRRMRREAGVAPKRKRRPRKHHGRRVRKAHEGLMMLWDGSPHQWFGEQRRCLMAAMDDATGDLLAAFFLDQECSWGYLELLRRVVKNYGIPVSVYQDKHTALKRNDSFWSLEEQLADRQEPTQVGMALEALGVEPIFANSPQAKGRIERLFETLQDRLVAQLAHAGITQTDEANTYLEETFRPAYNQRFGLEVKTEKKWRRPKPGVDLERICSFGYTATVGNDNCVRLSGISFDIPPGPKGRSYSRCKVEVRQLLDGSWRFYCQDSLIATADSTELREPFRAKRRRKDGARAAKACEWVYQIWRQTPEGPHSSAAKPTVSVRKAKGQPIQATKVA